MGSCIKVLPRKGQLLPSTGPAGLPPAALSRTSRRLSLLPFPGGARLAEASGALSEADGKHLASRHTLTFSLGCSWDRVMEKPPQSLCRSRGTSQ